jgi:ribonuclease BN (tRNA processing enzyme)
MSVAPECPISLTNDGDLALTFLGAGSAFSKKHYQNNLIAVKGPSHLLVDCGSRATEALGLLGLSVGQIENYLVTHLHADHIDGLEEAMLVYRYALRRKSAGYGYASSGPSTFPIRLETGDPPS